MNREVIHIRPALLEELPTLLEFEQGIIDAERPYDNRLAPDPIHYYDLEALIKSDSSEVIVATNDDHIIAGGYVTIKPAKPYLDHDRYAYVGFMFVRPEFRGLGVAQDILDHLTQWSKNKGLDEIRLEVYDENDPAVKAYKKAGFTKNLVETTNLALGDDISNRGVNLEAPQY